MVDGLELDDQAFCNKKVGPQFAHGAILVGHGDWRLTNEGDAAQRQFEVEGQLVDALEETRPLEGRPDADGAEHRGGYGFGA